MRLPPGEGIDEFMELRFKPGSWDQNGIPEEGCRLRVATFDKLLSQDGQFEADDLIYGLVDWLDVTDEPKPALATLSLLLDRHYPPDGRASARCRFVDEIGSDRIFHVGVIASSGDVVTWQRRGWVIALAQPSGEEPGRIVVGAPGPITLNTAQRILALSMTNFMMEPFDSYVGAQTTSRSTAATYSWAAGATTTCHWAHGLGNRVEDGEIVGCPDEIDDLPGADWLPPNQLAMMVAIAAGYLK